MQMQKKPTGMFNPQLLRTVLQSKGGLRATPSPPGAILGATNPPFHSPVNFRQQAAHRYLIARIAHGNVTSRMPVGPVSFFKNAN